MQYKILTAIGYVEVPKVVFDSFKSLETREQQAGNLLAVIHGDGGHYVTEHGWEKACEDAAAKWYSRYDRGENDEARYS